MIITCAILHNLAIDSNEPEPPADDDRINDAIRGGIFDDDLIDDVVLDDPPAAGQRRRGLVTARDRIIERFRERIRIEE